MIDEHLQIETALLGSMILDGEKVDECYIQPQEMEDNKHRVLLQYIKYAHEANNGKMDHVILLNALSEEGVDVRKVGGMSYIVQLTSSVPSQINFDEYQAFVRERFIERQLKFRTSSIATSEQGGAKTKLSDMQKHIDELQDMLPKKKSSGLVRANQIIKQYAEDVQDRADQVDIEIPSCSSDLDKLTAGHHLQDLEIVAARPSVGKTAWLINDSKTVAEKGDIAVPVYSLEMQTSKLTDRYICSIGNIDGSKLRIGNLDFNEWDRFHNSSNIFSRLPIFINDTPGTTVEQIKRELKALKKELAREGIGKMVVFIDYLQLLETEQRFQNNHEKIAYISKTLKRIARELNVKIVALSQLSRDVEKRQDKRPLKSDLAESGSLERDADVIIFLHREDYYDKSTEKKDIIEVILSKQRNGATGSVEMMYQKNFSKMLNLNRKQGGAS